MSRIFHPTLRVCVLAAGTALAVASFAKTSPEEVVLEIDDSGGVFYRFPRLGGDILQRRIDAEAGMAGVRVGSVGVDDARAQAEAEADAK